MVNRGYYTADCSDLIVEIVKVQYRDLKGNYTKVKLNLFTKSGMRVEYRKNYKLIHENIKHWNRFKEGFVEN